MEINRVYTTLYGIITSTSSEGSFWGPLRASPFFGSHTQAKYLKINFWAWSFYFIHLKCIFSNINCKKAFCLKWASNFNNHTQTYFRPLPILVILIQINWRKIDFLLWCFYFIYLECILSNRTWRKAFCLFWVSIAYECIQPEFQPRPFTTPFCLNHRIKIKYHW